MYDVCKQINLNELDWDNFFFISHSTLCWIKYKEKDIKIIQVNLVMLFHPFTYWNSLVIPSSFYSYFLFLFISLWLILKKIYGFCQGLKQKFPFLLLQFLLEFILVSYQRRSKTTQRNIYWVERRWIFFPLRHRLSPVTFRA